MLGHDVVTMNSGTAVPAIQFESALKKHKVKTMKWNDTIALGLIERYEVNYDFAQDIVERLCEDAWDEVGEASDGWLDSAKRPELDKLNEKILPIVREWLKEIPEEPSFYKVLSFEECTLAEALALHETKVANAPKGGKDN